MKLRLQKTSDKIIGSLRVPPEVFFKIKDIAAREKVTNQDVIRAILVEVIDTIE